MATKCIDHMPPPIVIAAATSHTRTRKSPGGPDAPAEIEGGVRRKEGDENGQSNEIGIVGCGSDHRDRPQFSDPTPVGRRVRRLTESLLQPDPRSHRLDRGGWPRERARGAAGAAPYPADADFALIAAEQVLLDASRGEE